jgi:hypothetical protein
MAAGTSRRTLAAVGTSGAIRQPERLGAFVSAFGKRVLLELFGAESRHPSVRERWITP